MIVISYNQAGISYKWRGIVWMGGRNRVYLHRDNVETFFSKRDHTEWEIKF